MKIIDNINSLLGDDLKASIYPKAKLKIAASCFSIYAYEALKLELSKIDSLEFIFTAPTFIPNEVTDKLRKERREFFIPKVNRERSLFGSEFEIQLRNKLTQRAIARECAEWMRRKVRFRSNKTKSPMQQFACIQGPSLEAAYMPLHGFTAVDLGYQQGDAVSNIVNRVEETAFTSTYLQLFDQIWNDPTKLEDVTTAICDHIASVYQENSPERIYFLMLYNIFSDFLDDIDEDVLPNDRTGYQDTLVWNKLFNFQRDAAIGIINKLETYNGCILADSVGLGKTFTALAVVKYYELRNRSVLVLCPKKLADNWLNYNSNLTTNIFSRDRFNYDVLCHTDLSRTSGESFGTPLNRVNWGNYDLVVIDESHNFRNNDAVKDRETRYQKLMNQIVRQGVKTKVLMLSATPVNNRFNDLRNQLALAYEGDSENLSKKLRTDRSVEEIFRNAQMVFNKWSKLAPEDRTARAILDSLDFDFFELLDSVTIARSRKHIQTFYDTSDIGQFPERRKPLSFHSPLAGRTDVMSFNEIFEQLSLLKLAVYAPISYILPSRLKKYEDLYDTQVEGGKGKLKQADRERSLQALMTTNLLKRLESSVEAFRLTLKSLHDNHARTLSKITSFRVAGAAGSVFGWTEAIANLEAEEDDIPVPDDAEIGGKVKINLADMDLPSWEHDLKVDLEVINALLSSMAKVTPEDDAKLQHLKSLILGKINNPINDGNRKILVFTAFADTANYLYNNLADTLLATQRLHTGKVTGKDVPKSTLKKNYDFQSLLTLFSPRAKEKAQVLPNEPAELDLLIGTDCISEGQNLQDCDYLINYDIHWNPVRIIQRFGRIDRIGSINKTIQLVNYWPDISLDEYINLKERVENRMVIADVTATGDDNVLTAKSSDISYRKEQLRRLQEEVIELEDLKTGVSITDLGLNDFRMDLLNYVKTNGDLANVPNGLHAVVPARPELGLHPGAIFALRNCNHAVNINQQNRLHPYYLIYISGDGQVIANHTEVKTLLDLVRSSCKEQSEPIQSVCRLFNQQTDEGRNMKSYSNLLDTAIRSMIDVKEEKDLDSLFSGGRTTALVNTIAGLDDFELIAFLVVQEGA
ncbi:helicase-related protein [Nitrosomonas mobilis]|uniref:SNF2-related:Helicase, C-terminal:type III restriction enzyme n=1 Tax=Nitrosomonas mobilis TaxID=51642 RepID=A0A1G5SII0_9PROT|nr:SNF2-related protein [Nitrosomonas mobilis]SCZ87023.1 SNF2-related:Helicase, C-terminal:type III restriction enzyme [Nitrosomonas mobilis]